MRATLASPFVSMTAIYSLQSGSNFPKHTCMSNFYHFQPTVLTVALRTQCCVCLLHRVSTSRRMWHPPADANAIQHMADIRRDWLTNQNTQRCFVVIGLSTWQSHSPLQQLKIVPVRHSPTKVRHIGWQLAKTREYLLTSVASTVSRRIFIFIRGLLSVVCDVSYLWLNGVTQSKSYCWQPTGSRI